MLGGIDSNGSRATPAACQSKRRSEPQGPTQARVEAIHLFTRSRGARAGVAHGKLSEPSLWLRPLGPPPNANHSAEAMSTERLARAARHHLSAPGLLSFT